ncbi:MAG TPA: OsmC family protein [Bacillus bacterium]|nr:OsmC family protein [Bacillus sp. (in: firmicutes)]
MNGINFEKMKQTITAIQANPEQKIVKWHASASWENGVKNEICIRDFAPYYTDEPKVLGGTDVAPNPVEYLIGAAVSCFIITFEVLASQKGIKLQNVRADIEADLNAAVFLGIEEGDGGILNPVITLNTKTSATKEVIEEIVNEALLKSPVLVSLQATMQVIVN